MKAIADAIKTNVTLASINLSIFNENILGKNKINSTGLSELLIGIEVKKTLKSLDLSSLVYKY